MHPPDGGSFFSTAPQRPWVSDFAVAVCLAWCVLGAPAAGLDATPAFQAQPNEEPIARAFVPSPQQRVGEVRLLRRGGASVVQTLLYTKVLRRVVGEIRKKELANWPPGAPGHDEAMRYIQALEAAREQIWKKSPKLERGADPRQKLLIELILDRTTSRVVLAEPEISGSGDAVEVQTRKPLTTLDLERSYVSRNMSLIVADSFAVEPERLQELLRRLDLEPATLATPPHTR